MAKKIIKAQMKQRIDTKANWVSKNPVLLLGELGMVSDDLNLYKVGDGTTAWNALPFRGFDGTLAQETGTSENAVMSQKAVTEKFTGLESKVGIISDEYYINASGALIKDSAWVVIEYTLPSSVQEGDVFVWNGIMADGKKCLTFFNDNVFVNAKSATGYSRTFTIGSGDTAIGANKIKASFLKSELANAYITKNGVKLDILSNTRFDSLESASLYGSYKNSEIDSIFKKGIYIRDKSEYQYSPSLLFVYNNENGLVKQLRIEPYPDFINHRTYQNGAWSAWEKQDKIVDSIFFIASGKDLPNFDTEKGVLDLGADPILCIGQNYYGKDSMDIEKLRNIPLFEGIGYATSTLRIYFNPNKGQFTTYTITATNEDADAILFCTLRIDKINRKIISVSAPFEYTINGEKLDLIELPYNLVKCRKLNSSNGASVYDIPAAHTDFITIRGCKRLIIDTQAWVSSSVGYDNAIILYDEDFSITRIIAGRTFAETSVSANYVVKNYNVFPNENEKYIRIGTFSDTNGHFYLPTIKGVISAKDYAENTSQIKQIGVGQFKYYGERISFERKRFQVDSFIDDLRYTGASGQGMTIYGDYLFQGGANGYINIYDLKTRELKVVGLKLASADLSNDHHCNNLCFGLESGTDFPLLYISEGTGEHRLFVEDITLETSNLIQTIRLNSEKLAYNKDWVIDTDNGFLYAICETTSAYNHPNNNVGIAKFRLPSTSEGDVIFTDTDIIEYFEISGQLLYVYQGSMYFDGKLFIGAGGAAHTMEHDVCVVDLNTQNIVSRIPMNQFFREGEIEGIAMYDGKLILAYPNQRKAYSLQF